MTTDLKIWLFLGLVPYRIHKQNLPGGLSCNEIRALFWTFDMKKRPSGRNDWTLRIPLIDKLRQAMWATVIQLNDSKLGLKEGDLEKNIVVIDANR